MNNTTDSLERLPARTGSPVRVQIRRSKGWRLPPNTIVVARPSKFGNPFWKGTGCRMSAAHSYECGVSIEMARIKFGGPPANPHFRWIAEHLHELRGKNLACWCPLDMPDCHCHAGVLLEMANDRISQPEGETK